jgi:hypothetical protein
MSDSDGHEPCSLQCFAEGEPLAGSAGDATTWIGLSWPKPRWDRSSVAQSPGLPAEIASLEREAAQLGHKLALRLFQRTPASSMEQIEMVLVRAGEGIKLHDVPIERAAGLARAFLHGETVDWPTRPLGTELFVCTDGKHDACCARLGRPLFKALLQARAETGHRIEISEASHLGGHRFAPNCLVLPQGLLYGRVRPEDARELLRVTVEGGRLSEHLRGRTGRSELAQVAEAFAHAHGLGAHAIDVAETIIEGDHARVRLEVSGVGSRWVRCEARRFHAPSSCGSDPELPGRRRWDAVSFDSDAGE